jgi:site-specific DNA recombinase
MSYLDTVQSIKRAALYVRVSTDMQAEKFSLPAQEKLTRELASKHGWEIVKTYRDEGFSGSWIEKRPQFSTLLQEAGAKKFDAVVVTDFDRLARPDNLKDLGRIQEVFIEHNVKIVTLSDIIDLSDDDQWFVSSLLGIVAAKEKKKIISRMKRGIEAKKEAGWFYGGIAPSGYQWDGAGSLVLRETKDLYHGKKKGQKYICYDWRTVRKFFDLYLYEDVSLKEICAKYKLHFNSLAHILDRAWFYAGFVLKTRGRAEWNQWKRADREPLAKGRHPAIITPDEAERVLEKRRGVYAAFRTTRLKFACSGLIKCECGLPMYVYRSVKRPKRKPRRTYYYYVCKTRHGAQRWAAQQKGIELSRCSMPFVRADHAEKSVWDALENFLISPQMVLDHLGNAGEQIGLSEKELKSIETSLAEIARRRSNLIDLYQYGRFKLAELDGKMAELERSEAALERRRKECLENIGAYRKRRLDPNKVYQLLGQIEEIFRFARREHRREIVRTLCREIKVKRDGELEISIALPQETALQRLSARMAPDGETVYPAALQWDAVVGERNLAGLRHRAAANQARVGDRMMRRTKWASGDDRLSVESTDNAMNLGGLERLGKGQIRKDRRQSLRQHCLS